jgi:hypothetical protein
MERPRWHATVYYRRDYGTRKVEHDLVELSDLGTFVDRGPHWDTIKKIKVFRINHVTDPNLTVERSFEL